MVGLEVLLHLEELNSRVNDDFRSPSPGRTVDDPGHLLLEDPVARRSRRLAALSITAAVLLTAGVGAGTAATLGGRDLSAQAADASSGAGAGAGQVQGSPPFGGQGFGGHGLGGGQAFGGRSQSDPTGSDAAGTPATAAQSTGVVTIDTRLGFQSAAAAGTGIVLTATGRVLTNNHVIAGATAIRATDGSTGRSYVARVVGTDAGRDIAVLQLTDADDLVPASIAGTAPAEGDAVTAVGNAGGTGTLTAAEGTVTDLDEQITTQAEGSSDAESLSGLIETDADVVSGDSGGPLKDAEGDVVGVTTAATSGTDDPTGYAIPVDAALSVAGRIVAGEETDGITIGLPAFLGVSVAPDRSAAVIAEVLDGTPAAGTGLAAGDTVTAVGGRTVKTADDLTAAIAAHEPGDRVRISFTTPDGTADSAAVTLVEGPAD